MYGLQKNVRVCACDPSVHLSVPSIGFVCDFVCQKFSPYVVSLCDFVYSVVG